MSGACFAFREFKLLHIVTDEGFTELRSGLGSKKNRPAKKHFVLLKARSHVGRETRLSISNYRYRKTGKKKPAPCFATLLQNEVKRDVARFTTHTKPVLQQIRLLTGLNMDGKMRNNATQLVLQQCCTTSCTFFVASFSVVLKHNDAYSFDKHKHQMR